MSRLTIALFLWLTPLLNAGWNFEGIYRVQIEPTFENLIDKVVRNYLPFDSTIIQIGGSGTHEAVTLSGYYPFGTIILFEPKPRTWSQIVQQLSSYENIGIYNVESTGIDTWCKIHNINRVDLIRVGGGGNELDILKSSARSLKRASVVFTKTDLSARRFKRSKYYQLKEYLEEKGFKLIAHWWDSSKRGEAVFIKKNIYDSVFN